jgi:hypothetical protein
LGPILGFTQNIPSFQRSHTMDSKMLETGRFL